MSTYDELYDDLMAKPRELITDWSGFREQRLPTMPRVVIGRRCYTDLSSRPSTQFVDAEDWPMSWRQLVPVYLRRQLVAARRRMAMNSWAERRFFALPAPLFYAGGYYEGEWAYIDIHRAYYSIYATLGCYNPLVSWSDDKITVLDGRVRLDEVDLFASDRIARNSIAGYARTKRHRESRYGERVWVDGVNRYSSPSLWAVIALVLNCVALDAIDNYGCIYAYTDGFIVAGAQVQAFRDYLAEWGLTGHIKGANGHVRGRGSYQLGEAVGHLPGDGKAHRALLDLSPAARVSLRSRFARLAHP